MIPQVDVVIHHGGNNSFTECLLFGKPAIIMPFAWDGHDNAMRVQETGHGYRLTRADWTEVELAARIHDCLHDRALACPAGRDRVRRCARRTDPRRRRDCWPHLLSPPRAMAELDSSAPHLANATSRIDVVAWGAQPDPIAGASQSSGRVLFKGPDGRPEAGLWICTPGRWRLSIPRDELCYFIAGRAEYLRDNGERVEILPETLVLFPAGWSGVCTVHETIRNTYMLTAEDPVQLRPICAGRAESAQSAGADRAGRLGRHSHHARRAISHLGASCCTRERRADRSAASGDARPGDGIAT